MQRRQFVQSVAAMAAAGTFFPARAADFPERPVRILLPYAAGNLMDIALRSVAEEIRTDTGQQLLIESKPGGAGIIAAQAVATAPADGYTLLLASTGLYSINPHTYKKLPYDPEKSFTPVTNFLGTSLALVTTPNVPAKNLREFIAHVKANPGKTSLASYSPGNISHMAGVLFNQYAGTDMMQVPFLGTPPAVQNLLGGQVTAAFLPLLAVLPHMKSGKVRVLAVSSPQRSPLAPDVPTFSEEGFPSLQRYAWVAVLAPAGTPAPVVAKLNQLFTKALNSPKVRAQWRDMDFEPLPSTPAEFLKFAREDSQQWAEAVRLSGYRADN
jgi:tripartite-type tricarboxylate transporter receptor subunit TctC